MPKRVIKFNPAFLTDQELIESFIVRHTDLELILQTVRENVTQSNQHILVAGPRGIGKTTLVLRAVSEIRRDRMLNMKWYPLVFGEESYEVNTPGEFWLEAIFHLAEQTNSKQWHITYEELGAEKEDDRLRERALAHLMDFADSLKSRILVVVENFNMIIGDQLREEDAWALRHTLQNEPRVMLLASATSWSEEIDNAGKPMFEVFKIHALKALNEKECHAVWTSQTGNDLPPEKIRPIQILTGGNPRLLTIISTFAAYLSLRQLMDNLMQLVDDHTEYFRSRLDALPTVERKVYLALAEIWDPATASEVAKSARLNINKTSSLLNRLISRGAVVVVDKKGRTKWYQIAERMYNIYYLMRRRGAPSRRVRSVVNFMVSFYEPRELVDVIQCIAQEACELEDTEKEAHYLVYQGIIDKISDNNAKHAIVSNTPPDFLESKSIPSTLRQIIMPVEDDEAKRTSVEIEQSAPEASITHPMKMIQTPDEIDKAERLARDAVKRFPKDASKWAQLGLVLYKGGGRDDRAEEAYRKAIEIDPDHAWPWAKLGQLLHERLERYEEAEKAYRKAIEIDPKSDWVWAKLGQLLHERLERYEEAEKAYRKASEIDPDHVFAIGNLGRLLRDHLQNYREAETMFRKIIMLDTQDIHIAWKDLGDLFYTQFNRYDEAIDAFRMAVKSKPENAEYRRKLAMCLSTAGNPEESLQHAEKYVRHMDQHEQTFEGAIDLFINIAAAGCVGEAIRILEASAIVEALEPLIAGLKLTTGKKVNAPAEVLEVAKDVQKRIEHRRIKLAEEKATQSISAKKV